MAILLFFKTSLKHPYLLLLLVFLATSNYSLKAQLPNLENHHIWIQATSNYHPIIRVQFHTLTDSTILYTKRNILYETPLKNIANLYIREKGKGAKEALKGAGIGLLSGLLIAMLDGPPSANCFLCISRQDKLKIYGISGAINGAAIGLLFGNKRKKIPINPQKRKHFFKRATNTKR